MPLPENLEVPHLKMALFKKISSSYKERKQGTYLFYTKCIVKDIVHLCKQSANYTLWVKWWVDRELTSSWVNS